VRGTLGTQAPGICTLCSLREVNHTILGTDRQTTDGRTDPTRVVPKNSTRRRL